MCSHYNRLIEAILMSTHNILLSIYIRKSPEIIQNTIMSAATGFFVRTQERVRNNRNVVNELPVFDPLKFYY